MEETLANSTNPKFLFSVLIRTRYNHKMALSTSLGESHSPSVTCHTFRNATTKLKRQKDTEAWVSSILHGTGGDGEGAGGRGGQWVPSASSDVNVVWSVRSSEQVCQTSHRHIIMFCNKRWRNGFLLLEWNYIFYLHFTFCVDPYIFCFLGKIILKKLIKWWINYIIMCLRILFNLHIAQWSWHCYIVRIISGDCWEPNIIATNLSQTTHHKTDSPTNWRCNTFLYYTLKIKYLHMWFIIESL